LQNSVQTSRKEKAQKGKGAALKASEENDDNIETNEEEIKIATNEDEIEMEANEEV
jgi:stalled ribosome alternative rescue factor ArfA